MKIWLAAVLLVCVCLGVYWPHKNAEFVLDDYYTVVRNPLIKNPVLYPQIWTSRLFDAQQSSGYIKFGYYRPVLQSSWILDYSLFGLKASGFQWLNLVVHGINCLLVYILFCMIFGRSLLALKAALLFCVLPSQEWVVRYVTGRGDELSALFALGALLFLWQIFQTEAKKEQSPFMILVFVCWALSALTREVAISYVLYGLLLNHARLDKNIGRISWYWVLIGLLSFLAIFSVIPKQGNILVWHDLYFASMGLCLWMAQGRLRRFVLLFVCFALVSAYQGQYWTTEKALLRHTRAWECWPHTAVDQQLLMKYDNDIVRLKEQADRTQDLPQKSTWLWRLGKVYYDHKDLTHAQEFFDLSLRANPSNANTLNALAVVFHDRGKEDQSLQYLLRSLSVNPVDPDTLKTLGIYYYIHQDLPRARAYLRGCLFLDPDNQQAHELLGLANKAGG